MRDVQPYDWALSQLRVQEAHKLTHGSPDVVVAVIDLGYRHHPDLDGHLWRNPNPTRGDLHGWDFADDDSSLEYTGPDAHTSEYLRGHHVFVAGEIAAVAPECPIMICRVGYLNPASWASAIRYAVDNGARVLVIPHACLAQRPGDDAALFYKGTDFSYPEENHDLRPALDYAYDSGCLIFSGTADNRGRRVTVAGPAYEAVCAVGSANRRDEPADFCPSADYVEFGAPAGQRRSQDETDQITGCGGDGNYIKFTGGCMACAFAGGVAALTFSRYPQLTNDQVRWIVRNTARPARGVEYDDTGWEPKVGYGILDAEACVSLEEDRLCRDVRVTSASVNGSVLRARLENHGIYDAERALVVAYNGDPTQPADPSGTLEKPAKLLQTQRSATPLPA